MAGRGHRQEAGARHRRPDVPAAGPADVCDRRLTLPGTTDLPAYAAVVLAGGSARRLGGLDKPAAEVGGRTLLDRVLAAVADADQRIVVGPVRTTATAVVWTREDPPGGGPAAGLGAALPLVDAAWVAVLAADLPFLHGDDVVALRAAALGCEGAVLIDDAGDRQWLAGVWHAAALRRCTWEAGGALRRQLAGLDVAEVRTAPRADAPWLDCDTAEALSRARNLA